MKKFLHKHKYYTHICIQLPALTLVWLGTPLPRVFPISAGAHHKHKVTMEQLISGDTGMMAAHTRNHHDCYCPENHEQR